MKSESCIGTPYLVLRTPFIIQIPNHFSTLVYMPESNGRYSFDAFVICLWVRSTEYLIPIPRTFTNRSGLMPKTFCALHHRPLPICRHSSEQLLV